VLITCWSAKGGSGTTTVACALATLLAARHPAGCLLVDGCGDAPGVLGLPEPDAPGLAGWLAETGGVRGPSAGPAGPEVPVAAGVSLAPRGVGALAPPSRVEALAGALAAEARPVVVDAGVLAADHAELVPLAAGAARSLLVTRACYLSLRRAVRAPLRPSGVVLLAEPGRALTRADVAEVVGVPVVAEVAVDPAVARAVDAGLLPLRLPRGLARALAHAA
jgi:hypothetical protein